MEKFHDGVYRPGEKLKGARSLAAEYGVGRMVAVCALEILTVKGYIYSEPRKGFFVSPDFKPNRYYALGIFLSGISAVNCGEELFYLKNASVIHLNSVVYGSDMDGGENLRAWLGKNRKMDGVLIYGNLTDEKLKPLVKSGIPYMVVGSHAISPVHPQVSGNLTEKYRQALAPVFAQLKGKRIGAMVGDSKSSSDRQTLQGVREAIQNCGMQVDESLLIHCEGTSYSDMIDLLMKKRADVIFAIGIFQVAIARCLQKYPDCPRPYIISNYINAWPQGLPRVADKEISVGNIIADIAEEAVEKLMKNIDRKNP